MTQALKKINDFEGIVTINLGQLVKDNSDLKTQMLSLLGRGLSSTQDKLLLDSLEAQLKFLRDKLSLLENDVRKGIKNSTLGASLLNGNIGGQGHSEELQHVWGFLQRFADEHAVGRIEVIKSENATLKDKVNVLGWLCRNHEFLTLQMITQVIGAYKESLTPVHNTGVRQAYITGPHGSQAVFTILRLLKAEQQKFTFDEDEAKQHKLAIVLSILE